MPKYEQNVNRGGTSKRESNIELFRIIAMILIVAHHYVVNSGLTATDGPINAAPLSWRSIFLLEFGAWGKIGINCFVLITGYFMCKSKITLIKFCKLLFEIMFYRIVIATIFWISGYEPFSFSGLFKVLIPIRNIGTGFTSAFLVFFLYIPFITVLVQHLNEKQHIRLLLLSCFTYVFLASIPKFSVTMNYVSWFIVLFFFASYIRLYPKIIFAKTKVWGWLSLACFVLCSTSVVAATWVGTKIEKNLSFFFVADSNKILALFSGICFFLFFKNLKLNYCRVINTIASSTFGVLLIHASSDTMRQWLWKDTLNNVGQYGSKLLPVYAVVSVVAIFAICVLIDQIRIVLLEEPFFKYFDKHFDIIEGKYKSIENKLLDKIETKNR